MMIEQNDITKLCSFYVSDWHLVAMLLPYINKKINEQAKIATILEKDIKDNVTTLVEKLNLKNKEKILNLNWNKTEERKLPNLEGKNEIIIIINGSKEYIERKNRRLDNYLLSHRMNSKIKIVNCYEIMSYSGSMNSILDQHDMVLNTSGEKEISDVFKSYNKEDLGYVEAI